MFAAYEAFAVHWVPFVWDSLARFGRAWTGWCAETGESHTRLTSPAEGIDLAALTNEVSRFGLHGVLVPPFRLNDPGRIWALERALALVADRLREVSFRGLGLAVVDGRVALVPLDRADELDRLARRIRKAVEPFALPQREQAAQAGRQCPSDMNGPGPLLRPPDSFHLPLTDPLPPDQACLIAVRLRPLVAEVFEDRHLVGEIALLADPGQGRRARVRDRYPLANEVASGRAYACRGPRVHAPLTQFHPAGARAR